MQNLLIKSNEEITSTQIIPTGYTGSVKSENVNWILDSVFANIHDLSVKSLDRYRNEIISEVPADDHLFYFCEVFGHTMYSEKILERRKYNVDRNKTQDTTHQSSFKAGNGSLSSTLTSWMKKEQWHYKCGANYDGEVSFERCHLKMKTFFDRLSYRYPDATITMFYTTEKNPDRPGFHNHFTLSIKPAGSKKLPNVKRTIGTLIKSIGSSVPDCVAFNPAMAQEHFSYITKYVNESPGSWWIRTTLPDNDFNAVFSPSRTRTIQDLQPRERVRQISPKWLKKPWDTVR